MFKLFPLLSAFTSVESTAIPTELASIEAFFCCSSEAMTLTLPFLLLTESETFSPVSISVT
jgi:hypothetical protein